MKWSPILSSGENWIRFQLPDRSQINSVLKTRPTRLVQTAKRGTGSVTASGEDSKKAGMKSYELAGSTGNQSVSFSCCCFRIKNEKKNEERKKFLKEKFSFDINGYVFYEYHWHHITLMFGYDKMVIFIINKRLTYYFFLPPVRYWPFDIDPKDIKANLHFCQSISIHSH